jgi:hypothetical protein
VCAVTSLCSSEVALHSAPFPLSSP